VPQALDPEAFRLLLVHELIHLRRRDLLVHSLVLLVTAVFFFHPVVLWLERRIRQEREDSVDDLVLSSGPASPRRYGEALLALEELCAGLPRPELAAAGGHLRSRIDRLTRTPRPRPGPLAQWALAAVTGAALLVALQQAAAAAIVAGDVLMRTPVATP